MVKKSKGILRRVKIRLFPPPPQIWHKSSETSWVENHPTFDRHFTKTTFNNNLDDEERHNLNSRDIRHIESLLIRMRQAK